MKKTQWSIWSPFWSMFHHPKCYRSPNGFSQAAPPKFPRSQSLAVHLELVAALLQVAEPFGGLLDLALKLGHRAWQQNIGLVNPPLEEMKNDQNPLVNRFFGAK